jgi:hypothetical protein
MQRQQLHSGRMSSTSLTCLLQKRFRCVGNALAWEILPAAQTFQIPMALHPEGPHAAEAHVVHLPAGNRSGDPSVCLSSRSWRIIDSSQVVAHACWVS